MCCAVFVACANLFIFASPFTDQSVPWMKENKVAAERAEESRVLGEYELSWCAVLLLCLLWLCFAVVVLYCEFKCRKRSILFSYCILTHHG